MLKNENLKQINNTITLLTTIKLYLLENDPTDFINKTGIDLIDIQHNIKDLITIHTHYTLEKMKQSDKVAQYHKDNAEKHRKYNREWARRNKEKKGGEII